jgi:amidase
MAEPSAETETIGGTGVAAAGATVSVLQQAMASGALTSVGLTEFYLSRIERLNPLLRAVISVNSGAGSEAAASDQMRVGSAARGPLEGIPVLVKDNVAARGLPATAGSPALLEAESGDAFLVTRLRAAGAVIIGKANMSEWANFRSTHSTSGWSTLGGQAANPYALDRSPSGSSSGSGVAVAAALAPLAVGTETDGSIVCPASACGIVGLKPTLGLVSRAGIVPISSEQDTAGPMARTVADAAALLSVLAGADPADPATGGAAGRPGDYTTFLDSGALTGARLGVWRGGCTGADTRTTAVLDAALARLRDQGAEVLDPVELPGVDDISEHEFAALLHEFKRDLNAYLGALPGRHPATLAELIAFNSRNGQEVLSYFGQELFERADATSGDPADPAAQAARGAATRLSRAALDGPLAAHHLDAIITLTANPACLTDYVLGDHVVFHTSAPAAVAGYPAVSVPCGYVAGLPVGLSFMGSAWSEPTLIGLAHAFEQAAQPGRPPGLRPSAVPDTAGSQRYLR